MCASYGLGGSDGRALPYDLPPMSEPANVALLADWAATWGGKANTTRTQRRGVNLNPVIWIDPDPDSSHDADSAAHHGEPDRRIDLAWWWLHVGGAPAKFTAFNSRDDALLTKWRAPFQHRALLPADWYFEGKRRWTLPDGELFGIAAILAPRATDDGGTALSYSMVTRSGVGEAASVVTSRGDSRMPLVLPREIHDTWLDPHRPGDAGLVAEVVAASEEISRAMTAERPTEPVDAAATLF